MADDEPRHGTSRARDHLANERVFLSWLRTAAEIMILGLFIAKVAGAGTRDPVAGGALLVAAGIGLLVYGTVRYNRVTREIERDEYLTGSRGRALSFVGLLLVLAILVALVLVVAGGQP